MELELDNFAGVEALVAKCLLQLPNVRLWTTYLDYVRRRNDLTNDTSGVARRTLMQSFELVIKNVGMDKDSGQIWRDYIEFIRSGPGTLGGTHWQDGQKMDQLRRVYQSALCVPTSQVNAIWREYDQFEMGLNKLTVSGGAARFGAMVMC